MIVTVKRMRRAGQKLTFRELEAEPGMRGDLRTHIQSFAGHEPVRVAVLVDVTGSGNSPALLPELYEPVLVGVAPIAMHLRGIERIKDGDRICAVVQEWLCLQG